MDRVDVHGVEHGAQVTLGVGGGGADGEPGVAQFDCGGVQVLEGAQPLFGHLGGRAADNVAPDHVEDPDRLVGGELRHHRGERDQGGRAPASSQVGDRPGRERPWQTAPGPGFCPVDLSGHSTRLPIQAR
ncbi:hypothetical protein OG592_03335 [Streptomyces avidinii]|uniref:hypothetical protein n=1 Tax=Streptomyces avidinii TaxID=1895 RepID=UPI00386A715B|nr:hypothetical protein OG592_03335 [Streptomyces avidinii]